MTETSETTPPTMDRTLNDYIAELDAMPEFGDAEVDHARADRLVVEALRAGFCGGVSGAALADAFERARDRVGFWYA